MLKTGITSMKVTCHHARKCHAEMMEYASHIRTTYMITTAIAWQDLVEKIVKLTLLVNQRIAVEESVYLGFQLSGLCLSLSLWKGWSAVSNRWVHN